jgi:nucleoside-diphosphate-sugar epimerase
LKTLLIIGGTGFFGNSILSYLSNSKILKRKFNKIIVISRNKLATFRYTKKLKKNYSVIKINCDILKLKKLPKADYVIYAAILKNYRDDYLAVKKYIKLAKTYHTNSKILFTSSGAVYGQQSNKIKGFKENYFKYQKKINFKKGYKQSYANFKIKSEKQFQKMGNEGFNVSIARCFAFVGEYLPLNSNFVIGNIIQNILDGRSIKINANYKIFRSYMYADDLVKWLFKILDNSNTQCPIYNIGSNSKISIHQVTNVLAKKYSLKIDTKKLSLKKNDNYMPNVSKAKKELGLKINNTSVEGIIKTINILSKKNHHDS